MHEDESLSDLDVSYKRIRVSNRVQVRRKVQGQLGEGKDTRPGTATWVYDRPHDSRGTAATS
jgi:hypothetical protein